MCLLGKTRSQSIVCARLLVWFIILNTPISCQTFREEAESNLLRSLIHLQGVLQGSFQTQCSHGHPFQDQNMCFPPHSGVHPGTQLDSTASLSHRSQGMGETSYRLQLTGGRCKTFPKMVPVHKASRQNLHTITAILMQKNTFCLLKTAFLKTSLRF